MLVLCEEVAEYFGYDDEMEFLLRPRGEVPLWPVIVDGLLYYRTNDILQWARTGIRPINPPSRLEILQQARAQCQAQLGQFRAQKKHVPPKDTDAEAWKRDD